jgi:hypothetical protein
VGDAQHGGTHNELWEEAEGCKFNISQTNDPTVFATQSYTTLIQTSPNEALGFTATIRMTARQAALRFSMQPLHKARNEAS